METNTASFDKVLDIVGANGKFQKQFSIVYDVGLVILSAMVYMDYILTLAVPDHWCYLPGRPSNYSLKQWKDLYIPIDNKSEEVGSLSKCIMYNISLHEPWSRENNETIACRHGYEYDKTWFTTTVPTTQDWVCGSEIRVSNVYAISTIAELAGALLLGYGSDRYGRRFGYIVGVVTLVVGRFIYVLFPQSYIIYMIGTFISSFASLAQIKSVFIISMEISKPQKRAKIATIQTNSWVFGTCFMSLLYWYLGDWKMLTWISTCLTCIYLLLYPNFIESPRWLATQGKKEKCVKILEKIAKSNGRHYSKECLERIVEEQITENEMSHGIFSVLSSKTLAKNTILLIISLSASDLCGYLLVRDVTNLEGNPFVNFILQAIVSFPGSYIGMLSADYIGRRWTASTAFLASGIITVISAILSSDEIPFLSTTLFTVNTLCLTVTSYVISLQLTEIYPTSLRQSGMSLGSVVSLGFSMVGPYITLLTSVDTRLPHYILAVVALTGMAAEFFLPETLNVQLPESIQEARKFGKGQSYFSLPKKVEKTQDCSNNLELENNVYK